MPATRSSPRHGISWPLREALDLLDAQLASSGYRAISVPTRRIRAQLRAAGRPFIDPDRPQVPTLPEVDATAHWIIAQSSAQASTVGGVAGLAGALSLPHETGTTVLSAVRLAQRLAVVYGFDPETDRGRMALWRALAAGFEVELPDRGPVGMRLGDLPAILFPGRAAPRTVGSALASRILRRAAKMVGRPSSRWFPLISSAPAALHGRRRSVQVGQRMQQLLRQISEVPLAAIPSTEDAVEIPTR